MHKYTIRFAALIGAVFCMVLLSWATGTSLSRLLNTDNENAVLTLQYGDTLHFDLKTITRSSRGLQAALINNPDADHAVLSAVVRSGSTNHNIPFHIDTAEQSLVLDPMRAFAPGLYTLIVEVQNPISGETQVLEQDFAWGVLAMNADKDLYKVGDIAALHFGVLDDAGKIVCDAELSLTITKPNQETLILTTEDQSIQITNTCGIKEGYLIDPDYAAFFTFDQLGSYTFDLTAETENGIRSIRSSIEAEEAPAFTIQRKAATRLWPEAPSTMEINVTFAQNFNGTITDILPPGFKIIEATPEAQGTVTSGGGTGTLSWAGSWKAGEIATFHYTYDAPDISPQFYLVGPLTLDSRDQAAGQGIRERRAWQIANDDTSTKSPGTLANDSTIGTTAWTNPSDAGASDAAYATASITGEITQYLKATNFGFTLGNSTIDGIEVLVERRMNGNGCVQDYENKIVKGGTIGSTNKANPASSCWSDPADQTITYGGPSDLWGETWAYTDIESSSFGTVIAAEEVDTTSSDAMIDHIQIRVTYTPGVGGSSTIAGRVYSTDLPSGLLASRTVGVSLNGGATAATADTDAGGMYSIGGLTMTAGTLVTVFLDGETEKAALVTLGSGSSMTGVDLYADHLILRSDSGSVAMNNTYLANADNNGDTDITSVFSVSNGILQMGYGKELFVWTGDTYTPGGRVRTHDLEVRGTMSMETNGLTVSGSLIASAGTFSTSTGIYLTSTNDNETLNFGSNAVGGDLVIDSGLVGYWKFDEASGLIAKDSSRYGYDGTLAFGTGAWTTSTPSKISFYNPHSIEFWGSTAVNIGDTYLLDFGAGDFTLSAWVYNDTQTKSQSILSKDAGGARQIGFSLNVNESAAVEAGVLTVYYSGASAIYLEATTNSAVSASTWTHVLAKRKAGSTTLWVNGAQIATTNNTSLGGTEAMAIKAEESHLYIGRTQFAGFESPFDGKIDDVRIYNRALADSEIARLAAGNQDTGSGVYELGANLDLNSSLRIYGGTLDASGSTVNVSGNWYNVGGFTKRSGTVTFDGTNQIYSGSTVFNNFSKAVASADSMYFDWKGRLSVSGALTLNGAVGQVLTLRSTNTGSGWNILLDGDGSSQSNVSYLDVKNSDASGGQEVVCFTGSEGCVNSGDNTNWLFTKIGTGTIKGTLWNDADGDRTLDAGETTGFSGISVSLSGTKSNGNIMSSGATTNAAGQYFFSGATVSNPTGYTVTVASVPTGYLKTKALSSGSLVLGTGGLITHNFGFVQASSISGAVFVDLDDDGVKDSNETSVFQSVILSISGTSASGNTVTGTQTTNSSGLYAFRNLGPSNGSYTVSISSGAPSNGYAATVFTSSGISIATGGTRITSASFGYMWYGTMSGVVFIDDDGDGVKDAGETDGLSNVTITLTGETSSGATVNTTTVTTSTGAFNFYNVPISSGSYTVTITEPSGYAMTTATSFTRTVSAGTHATSTKFGLDVPTTVVGTVYTNEGITAIGAGKKVSLSVSGSTVTASGFTVSGGQYTISSFTVGRGDVMTVYLDDETENAVVVTIGTGSNMTGVHLYQDKLILRNLTGGTITNTHIATADDTADADITGFITSASAGAVTINSSFETIIWTGTTFAPGGTFTGGDIEIDGTWSSGGAISARDLQVDGTFGPGSTVSARNVSVAGTFTSGGAVTASGVTVTGTLTTGGNALTANRMTASGTLTLGASVVIVRGTWNTGDATFTTSGHVHLRGTGSTTYTIARGSSAFQHLTTSGSYSLISTLDVEGNYALSGGTLDVTSSNYRITVAGDWHNAAGSGAFLAHSGSVVLDGYGSAQRVTGSTYFNKLTKTGSTATTLTFGANQRQFFSGSLVLKGTDGQLLSIRSSTTNTKANLMMIHSGSYRQDVEYLDVQDSDAGSGYLLYCLETDDGCENSGNNTNWLFSATCGDSIVHSPEECDEGDSNSNAANASCRTDCTEQGCGDGIVDSGEACDDGNASDADACLNSCELPVCGDGFVSLDEQCEPPDTATCASNCAFRTGGGGGGNTGGGGSSAAQSYSRRSVPAGCGNGVVQSDLGEECDEGAYNDVGTCSYDCKVFYCGDGEISPQIGEDCEPPKTTTPTGQTVFASQTCGKICSLPELTDEGGLVGGCKTVFLPACGVSSAGAASSAFSITPAAECGNGTVELGEECDGGESCSESCLWNFCGDGEINQISEQCDNGSVCANDASRSCRTDADCPDSVCNYNKQADSFCSVSCTTEASFPSAPVCGDGIQQEEEECDDGNGVSGDGCSLFCRIERQEVPGTACGNAVVESGEQCDQGAQNSDTVANMCRIDCSLPTCGDSIIDDNEECDGGTRNSNIYGDRCRKECKLPRCGDGIIDSDEYCDGGISCRDNCTGIFQNLCGNSRIDQGEQCDDGNTIRGDGCGATCVLEILEDVQVRPAAPGILVRPRLPQKVSPQPRTRMKPAAPVFVPVSGSPLLPSLMGRSVGSTDPAVTVSAIVALTAGVIWLHRKKMRTTGKK